MKDILQDNPFPKDITKEDIKRFLYVGKIRSDHETKIKVYLQNKQIVIYCVTKDKPFTIETLIAICEKYGFSNPKISHNIKTVTRDEKGAIKTIKNKTDQNFESFIKCTIGKRTTCKMIPS